VPFPPNRRTGYVYIMPIATINPATGELVKSFQPLADSEIEYRLNSARDAFRQYRDTPIETRAAILTLAAGILEDEQHDFAKLMTLEMGKPMKAAAEEAAKCATACRYYAEHGARLLADRPVPTNATRSFVRFRPLGTVLAVMPWNFPFWQVFRFAAPTLIAGNTGLLKHASNVPQCALAIEDILRRAGAPQGVFQTLLIGADQVERLIEDPRVAAVTLTGSEGAGIRVGAAAGKALKKSVLELGGSDPFIVMPSADLEQAAQTAVRARTINNGQSCIAAKRFIVHERIYDTFAHLFTAGMRQLRTGDPMHPDSDIGPLSTQQTLNDLIDQVNRAVDEGARILTGGHRLDRPGYYFPPTVIENLPRTSPLSREEIFGPVATLIPARNLDEAIDIANDNPFGLGASAWTRDPNESDRFIDELEAGLVFINGMVASDARLPFGGVKRSGYGRELAEYGLLEFVNVKTIWIKEDPQPPRTATE
jgi:succinate-semialdehyde dehydrogenase / glutarate-semialdehyde dehydrogenase